jgi:hypothetical protein
VCCVGQCDGLVRKKADVCVSVCVCVCVCVVVTVNSCYCYPKQL